MGKSILPKVISKANKTISTIIESDIKKESQILKKLVDDVLASNMEIKKRNNQRILETKRKLQELDNQIDQLNLEIERVDRDTVVEQLNQMIDSENRIFTARQKSRFYENSHLDEQLETLEKIYQEMINSIKNTKKMEESYKILLVNSGNLLFDEQLKITNEILQLYIDIVSEKREFVYQKLEEANDLKQNIKLLENKLNEEMSRLEKNLTTLKDTSTFAFTIEDDEELISEKIKTEHENKELQFAENLKNIEEQYHIKREAIIQKYKAYENSIRERLEKENMEMLQKEKQLENQKQEKLKNIRLLIMDAQKKEDFNSVKKLMKDFEKVEKSGVTKVTDRTKRILSHETAKTRENAIAQLKNLYRKYIVDVNKHELLTKLEAVDFTESKMLYTIKSDYLALVNDESLLKQKFQQIEKFFSLKRKSIKEISALRLQLRLFELDVMKENEFKELSIFDSFQDLLSSLAQIEKKRLLTLQENINQHDIIKIEQQFQIRKAVLDIRLSRDLFDIDKRILKLRNDSLIKIEKLKEDANNEIVYQESLIKIAQKERELQLKKVQALFENERDLAEEQSERIVQGIKINDSFVKTTLENQLLFSEQQIKFAQSEFDIRMDNINLTKDQELAYANKKINYYRQKYLFEKSKLQKELNDKLEDLNFKLALFTEETENEKIQNDIAELKDEYEKQILKISKSEENDENIIRYEQVIESAEARAKQAIEEAVQLRDKTLSSFELLLEQTKEKFAQLEENKHSEEATKILPLLGDTVVSNADTRLKKAIKEADALFEERIEKPKQKIQQTKETLLKITKADEVEEAVQQQKELKKKIMIEYNEKMELIKEEMNNELISTEDEVERAQLIQKKLLQYHYDELQNKPFYRPEKQIEEEYINLKQREINWSKEQLDEVNRMIDIQLLEHRKVLKDISNWIKGGIKHYKKYIRTASSGLNAEKKEIKKKNKRLLKKELSEKLSEFYTEL